MLNDICHISFMQVMCMLDLCVCVCVPVCMPVCVCVSLWIESDKRSFPSSRRQHKKYFYISWLPGYISFSYLPLFLPLSLSLSQSLALALFDRYEPCELLRLLWLSTIVSSAALSTSFSLSLLSRFSFCVFLLRVCGMCQQLNSSYLFSFTWIFIIICRRSVYIEFVVCLKV